MQEHKHFTDKVVTRFRLSERVLRHNLCRRLSELLDWDFLYQQTHALYSHTGQPSLDPVVFFKLVLVGRLENIASDRRLVAHCALRLDILCFLGYEVDEDFPWHSTLSRTRQLYPAAVFEYLFDHIFAQCVAAGLVAGDTQTVDSAPVKASASLDSLRPKQPPVAPTMHLAGQPSTPPEPVNHGQPVPAHQLRREAARQAKRRALPGGLGASMRKRSCCATRRTTAPPTPRPASPSSPAEPGP
ncbi:transposase [Hymenobacter coccineus]|uniref:Transposase InsH N-terminal domain-containing protein n=1 Tax=Hymenobacter coccineus TaxID=1908235 RepID=A0A1G1STY6_9BACT|nr:transposase [Hymenobacter coccineus]OGX82085.1 hypothetical protein BEN49_02715 [Hymenobacter coccineus]